MTVYVDIHSNSVNKCEMRNCGLDLYVCPSKNGKRRRYEQFKAFTSILVNLELSDKNKARYKQDKASADFSTGDLRKVNEREKTQA